MKRIKTLATGTHASLETSFALAGGSKFEGFVTDPSQPTRRFTVELLLDGFVIQTAYADNYIASLAERPVGDGCYGFTFSVPSTVIDNATMAQARLANLPAPVGVPILLNEQRPSPPAQVGGRLRWLGGLRFSGWLDETIRDAVALDVKVDGELVRQVRALGWAQVGVSEQPARAYDFHIPDRFADGCVHHITLFTGTGETMPGGSVPFVAYPDGLASTLAAMGTLESERLRGEIFDKLIPMSMPLSDYESWRQRFPVDSGHVSDAKIAVVLVGNGAIDATLDSLEAQSHSDWIAGDVGGHAGGLSLDAETVRDFLAENASDSDIIVFAIAGTIFEPNALRRLANAFDLYPEALAAYGDLDVLATDGRAWPLALPAFDYERMLEQGYCAHLFALRSDSATAAMAMAPSNLYRLFNSLCDDDKAAPDRIVHLPGALATLPAFDRKLATRFLHEASSEHLKQRKVFADLTASVSGIFPAVRVRRKAPSGRTCIVIPTRDRVSLLRDCIDSIRPAVEQADVEVLIVDNDSSDPETLDYLVEIADPTIRVLHIEGPFNFAHLNNLAVQATDADYLCLLNNDIQAIDSDWLDEMLSRIADPNVGAVGSLLLWPSGVVQHGGVVLGPIFSARHAFNDRLADDAGYLDMLHGARECSAVTAACLLTRRSDYLAVNGMDAERLAVAFNDVDYCLKLRAAGKRVVFTPHARLRHIESASRGHDLGAERKSRFERELLALRARWGQSLLDDPFYSPQLSLDGAPFSALAWPPRNRQPRLQTIPPARYLPPGY